MKQKQNIPSTDNLPIPVELVERRIYMIRGQKVMLDADLAELYQIITKNLNLAVRRNVDRFPSDFMFQLTTKEAESLRLQVATSKIGRGGRRYLPYAFTELGVAMLSSVLNSKRAVQMNILIMRAFVKLREVLATHKDLAQKISELEKLQRRQGTTISQILIAVNNLIKAHKHLPPAIGFRTSK